MHKSLIIALLIATIIIAVSFSTTGYEAARLRKIYSRAPGQWPTPSVDSGIAWTELGLLPAGPLDKKDSVQGLVQLGKILFFDPRLSSSGKIACATCHQPELSWTDGKERSAGHEGQLNKRNAPTIQNSWFYERLFWDGRSSGLEDQAFAPINSESEMHNDMRELPFQLRKIKGYPPLFKAAYGDEEIEPDRIVAALAAFQRTIRSRPSAFDEFLSGKKNALNASALRGLHLFRTKARCMNCHHGPFFSDNQFHHNGFAGEDAGRYLVTHKEEDRGRMKTPSLRDVMMTRPWMHDGRVTNMDSLIAKYNAASPVPGLDARIRPLQLTKQEKRDLITFLQAISAPPLEMGRPVLPD